MAGIFGNLFGRKQRVEVKDAPPALTWLEQIKLDEAERLIAKINESMQFYKASKNLETGISKLNVADEMVKRLRKITTEYPLIKISQLNKLESQIAGFLDGQMPVVSEVSKNDRFDKNCAPEHSREFELRQLAKSFGVTSSNCPNCNAELKKFPQRKTRVWTQLHHCLIANKCSIARKFRLSFSNRVASRRMSFILQKNRSTILRMA